MKPNTLQAYELMHQGALALAQIEENGVRIDEAYLEHSINELSAEVRTVTEQLKADEVWLKWQRRFGSRAVIGNKQQLAEVVFEDLGYKSKGETTKKGYKADEAAFDHVDHPFVRTYIRLEKVKKALNTYLRGWKKELVDGYIHPFYNLHIALTYRSSCDTPNFQNIPTRLEFLRDICRRAFISRFGKKGCIVEFDFKGIEVGVSCCYHFDKNLTSYVKDKSRDMHRDTAMELFGLEQNAVSKDVRHIAKNKFVFPQFYGDWAVKCARNIWEELSKTGQTTIFEHLAKNGITELGDFDPNNPQEKYQPRPGTFEYKCQEVSDSFWNVRFPEYTAWKQATWEQYQQCGYVKFHTGFVAEGIFEKNKVLNYQIQGSAFHCTLWSVIKIQKWLVKNDMKSKIIGTIHDSVILDVHLSELDRILKKLKEIMSKELPAHWDWIVVPLEVEVEVAPPGSSWLEKGKYHNKDGTWIMKA